MPIPFDMMAVMLFLGYYAETPAAAPPLPEALAAAGVYCLGLLAASVAANRLVLRAMRARRNYTARRRLAATADLTVKILLVAAFVAVLEETALPWSLLAALGGATDAGSLAVQIIGVCVYLLFFVCAWLPMYGLHREVSVGNWTRASFMLHKARYNLFVLLAWLPFALLADWLSGFLLALPALFLLATWTFPLVLARAWGCKRLPPGEIEDMVKRLEKRAGVGFSKIYLWEPGGGDIQNAAAVGILPPFRFLFLTPALIRNMKGDELEAVILHELGHVRKKHLLFYLFTSLAGINAAVIAGALLPLAGGGERFVATAVLVLVYFRFVFGWLSRNMERQADLYALEQSGSASGLANALEKLGLSAGNIRLASSWHHLGIAERVRFLRLADHDRELARRHNAGVSRIMVTGYLTSALVIGALVWAVHEDFSAPPPPRTTPGPADAAHWRRVMRVVPDSATAPLELAYSLAGKPGSDAKREAMELADRAIRLSGDGEEKAAAAKLLSDLEGGDSDADGNGAL